MDINEKKIELLSKQCEIIDQKILTYQSLGSKILGFGATLILSILALALKEELTMVLFVLPAGMFTLIFYWMNVNSWVLSEGGYKKAIEEKINEILEEDIYLWESKIAPSKHTNINNLVLNTIFTMVLLASVVASYHAAVEMKINYAPKAVVVVSIIFFIAAICCLLRNRKEFNQTYEEARKYFKISKMTIANRN